MTTTMSGIDGIASLIARHHRGKSTNRKIRRRITSSLAWGAELEYARFESSEKKITAQPRTGGGGGGDDRGKAEMEHAIASPD